MKVLKRTIICLVFSPILLILFLMDVVRILTTKETINQNSLLLSALDTIEDWLKSDNGF